MDNRWQLLQARVFEKRINEAVAFLRLHKIEPILIKGWAAAKNYPDSSERGYTDIDLIVAPHDYNIAQKHLQAYRDGYLIDLHKAAKSLDTLSYEDLYKNSKIVICGDSEIRVLSAEDHLRVLCVHWLISGGTRKDRLWDIYYAVENRPKTFDWDKCLNVVSQTRQKWIVSVIGLTRKYLNLNLDDTPIAGRAADIPVWLIRAVEKEWASDTVIMSLEYCLGDRKRLWQQIKKRIPPNPIQATIEAEGEFDDGTRIFYQIRNAFQRLEPSIKRIAAKITNKTKS